MKSTSGILLQERSIWQLHSSLISQIKEVAKFPSETESERIISGMKWMGILSAKKATIVAQNLLDTLCAQLEKLMSFKPGERDLVMLQHKFVVEWADGKKVFPNLKPLANGARRLNAAYRKPSHLPLNYSGTLSAILGCNFQSGPLVALLLNYCWMVIQH